ncbi:MAG: FAD-dependent oxidoreductase [Candidatus Nanopelagicales bacterium]|jgi:NADPH-dependent 2,4-dienoyl-CoA reductase/sulfur reductase-like enzyme/rhodanese-related sulfurtransferase
MRRVVVIGGVAGGMSAAARLRRLDESAEIVVLEKGGEVSFANCGLPYHVGGEIAERDALLLHTPETLRASLDLDVRVKHEAVSIDRENRTVRVRDLVAGTESDLPYDALVLATGAEPIVPPLPGIDRPEVRTLRTVPDADVLRDMLARGARRAVVIGAGFIGLETVEAFVHRGLATALVELAPQVLPAIDEDMAQLVEAELVRHGVDVRTGVGFTAIEDSTTEGHAVDVVLADGTRLPADVVLLGVGVRPKTTLAADAGLELSDRGAVVVSPSQRTSDPAIWAVGDAIQVIDAVTGVPGVVPLAGPANRQGRIAADSIAGREASAKPVLGTAVVKVFDLTAAVTGPTSRRLTAAGVEHHVVHLHPGNHAGYYPGAKTIHLALLFTPEGRVLGAQAVGTDGVDKRIDVVATALRAEMTVDDLAELELAYAPPFGSAKDPVNMAAFLAQNLLDGTTVQWSARDLEQLGDVLLLDVRSAREFESGHLVGALNVPHTEIRERLDEVLVEAAGRPVRTYCASGFRSYLAHRVLAQAGVDSATLDGGMQTLRAMRPDVVLEPGAGVRALVGAGR